MLQTKTKELNEWIASEKQRRKESCWLCECMSEIDTLVNHKGDAKGRVYQFYLALVNRKLYLPSIHFYIDNISFKVSKSLTVVFKNKYIESILDYPVPVITKFNSVSSLLSAPEFLDNLPEKEVSDETYESLEKLILTYIYSGTIVSSETLRMSVNADQIDLAIFRNLLVSLERIRTTYPTGMTLINGKTTATTDTLNLDLTPTYRFYDGLVSFSVEIVEGSVRFKDYQGSLDIPQSQLVEYYPIIQRILALVE